MNEMLTTEELNRLQRILAEELDVQPDQITPDSRLDADLGADSLAKVEIGMRVEEEFQITIPDDQLERVETVQDIRDVLTTLLGHRSVPLPGHSNSRA